MTKQARSSHPGTVRCRGGWRATVLCLASLAMTVAGCAPSDRGSEATATIRPDTLPPATTDPGPSVPAPLPSPDPVPQADCDGDVLDGVSATIGGQLAAFAAGDFARAYAFASEGFRGTVALEEFEAIVRDGYATLLDLASHEVLECRTDGRRAAVLVGVVDSAGTPSLVSYAVVRETDGWRIQGAQGAGLGPPSTTT